MGQYYIVLNIDKKQYFRPFLQKLMEHSWMECVMMKMFAHLILHEIGPWSRDHIIWAGDYGKTPWPTDKDNWSFVGGYVFNSFFIVKEIEQSDVKIFVNLDKNQYVNLRNCPKSNLIPLDNSSSDSMYSVVHPVPILLSDGNGLGLGDYKGNDEYGLIGSWRGDRIESYEELPVNHKFTEIFPNFIDI